MAPTRPRSRPASPRSFRTDVSGPRSSSSSSRNGSPGTSSSAATSDSSAPTSFRSFSFTRPPNSYYYYHDNSSAHVAPRAAGSTALSTNEPDFSFKTQPSQHARQPKPSPSGAATTTSTPTSGASSGGGAPRGKLLVKLVQARHLSPPSIQSRPYVVVSFDQNEFVSREPVHEGGEDVTGLARPVVVAPPVAVAVAANDDSTQPPRQPESPIPDLKGRLPLPATPGGGLNPGEPGYEEADAPAGAATTMSRSPASGLGRKLEEYSSSLNASRPSATTTKPELAPVDTTAPIVAPRGDEAKTPTGTGDEPTNGLLSGGDAEMAYNPTWKHEVYFDVMNEKSPLVLQIYDRSIEEECFLGFAEIRPRLVNNHTIDQWFPLQARPGEDHAVTGEIRIQIRYEKYDTKRGLSVNDFDFLRMIGKGTFGRVFQVRKKDTKRIYAMKVLSKREIVAKKEIAHTIGERKILQRSSDSPFLLGLKFSFQTEQDLYLIMDYKSGGELFHHLQKEGRFTEDRARFYTAEIVLAFEHLHKFDIVYRDLKPENILLDATGHIVLCDFGLSKPDLPSDALTNTFCGTTEYLAPEVLLDDNGYSKIVDFWSLGVLLFEMCCGWSPFYAEDTQQMYKLICFGKVKFPRGVIGEDGKQFVKGLLNRNPKHRLGATRDAEELKEHAFFKSIDWDLLGQRAVPPPFKPYVDSDESVANFDPEFTEANLFDEAPHDVEFDESDPSPTWLDRASELSSSRSHAAAADIRASPMEIRNTTSRSSRPPVQPLTNSVQENFRGFTFSGEGESMIHHAAGSFAKLAMTDASSAEAVPSRRSSGADGHEPPSMRQVEDEWEDER
ncbi:hypothetical protein JCM11491_003864 [Sporobolomyces phaffii]